MWTIKNCGPKSQVVVLIVHFQEYWASKAAKANEFQSENQARGASQKPAFFLRVWNDLTPDMFQTWSAFVELTSFFIINWPVFWPVFVWVSDIIKPPHFFPLQLMPWGLRDGPGRLGAVLGSKGLAGLEPSVVRDDLVRMHPGDHCFRATWMS